MFKLHKLKEIFYLTDEARGWCSLDHLIFFSTESEAMAYIENNQAPPLESRISLLKSILDINTHKQIESLLHRRQQALDLINRCYYALYSNEYDSVAGKQLLGQLFLG